MTFIFKLFLCHISDFFFANVKTFSVIYSGRCSSELRQQSEMVPEDTKMVLFSDLEWRRGNQPWINTCFLWSSPSSADMSIKGLRSGSVSPPIKSLSSPSILSTWTMSSLSSSARIHLKTQTSWLFEADLLFLPRLHSGKIQLWCGLKMVLVTCWCSVICLYLPPVLIDFWFFL